MRVESITLDIYAIIVITMLLIVCVVQRKQSKQINRYLIGWMTAHVLMLCCDIMRWSLRGKIHALRLFTWMFFSEYILCYICLIFFHYYFVDYMKDHVSINRKLRLLVWPVSIVMSILWILSYKNRMFYVITYNAVNVASQGYYLSQLPGLLVILLDMGIVFYYKKEIGWRQVLSLWSVSYTHLCASG